LAGGVSYTYNRNVYVLPENNITDISTWAFNMNGKVYFLKTFMLAADASKQFNKGYSSAINTNPFMINATLEKAFFKNKFTLRLQGFNLLDETARTSQSISGNSIVENRSNLLGRYFLLSVQCDLKMFK
jgi:outer membrane receptor protein involved in Fe transport